MDPAFSKHAGSAPPFRVTLSPGPIFAHSALAHERRSAPSLFLCSGCFFIACMSLLNGEPLWPLVNERFDGEADLVMAMRFGRGVCDEGIGRAKPVKQVEGRSRFGGGGPRARFRRAPPRLGFAQTGAGGGARDARNARRGRKGGWVAGWPGGWRRARGAAPSRARPFGRANARATIFRARAASLRERKSTSKKTT